MYNMYKLVNQGEEKYVQKYTSPAGRKARKTIHIMRHLCPPNCIWGGPHYNYMTGGMGCQADTPDFFCPSASQASSPPGPHDKGESSQQEHMS